MTDRIRIVNLALWVLVSLASVIGWFFGNDPADLAWLHGAIALALGFGEASNVGKRATFKSEAVDAER